MANPVSARYAEAAFHKFPNATSADIVVVDRSDGAGPQLIFWNPSLGPQMSEAEATTELAAIDAARLESARISSDSGVLLNLLRTGSRTEIGARADQIVDFPTLVTKFKELYLYLASKEKRS